MDIQELQNRLDYNEKTGDFIWKVSKSNRIKQGQIAGYKSKEGYVYIYIFGKRYLAHRLAFYIMEGYCPEVVDHKNGNPSDNSWNNLRKCTQQENCQNSKPKGSDLGFKNVVYYRNRNLSKPYQVQIKINGSPKSFGFFTTAEEANQRAIEVREELFGEFARNI